MTDLTPFFFIKTDLSKDEVRDLLKPLEPWRVKIGFSNGFDTETLETMRPWNTHPLYKLKMLADYVGMERLKSKRVLDIGFNAGYNSILLSQNFGCDVVGIDNNRLNLSKAEVLCDIAGASPELLIADAHDFVSDPFDIVLHLGTLYHLQDPIKSMRTAASNLKPGGMLVLETTGCVGNDPLDCRLIYGWGGDTTNYWALGSRAIELILEDAGLKNISVIKTLEPKVYEGSGLNRILLVAER